MPDVNSFHHRLHQWYGEHGRRDLPWRKTADPYAIYVSEIMLQQTQVKTVLERYYFPFLKCFPTLQSLANAKQDDVLRAWQGLGYYNRALNLHKAAKVCIPPPAGGRLGGGQSCSAHKLLTSVQASPLPNPPPNGEGTLPQTVDELMAIPGIGRNTAHAIAAFAYHQPVAVMEANVRRVVSRIFALAHPTEAELWDKAQLLLDTKKPFDYNQAMMDIGALVCKKRAPLCGECPAQKLCKGKSSPESYPAAKINKAPPLRRKRIIIFRNAHGQYYASPRTGRFLNGLYHFVEADAAATHILFGKRRYAFADATPLGHVRRQYSHFTLEAEVRLMIAGTAAGKNWHSPARLAKLPMSMAERKIIALLNGI